MSLPQELIDNIIDFAADYASGLSLVHRTWLPAARGHLFRSVEIRQSNYKEWLELLDSSLQTFANHVQHIQIYNEDEDEDADAESRLSLADSAKWFTHPKLTSIQGFSGNGFDIHAMPDIHTLSNLSYLELGSLGVASLAPIATFISLFSSLKRLEMDSFYPLNPDIPVSPIVSPKAPKSLKSVTLAYLDIYEDAIVQWLADSTLTLADIKLDIAAWSSTSKLFDSHATTLKRLDLDFLSDEPALPQSVSLPFTSLEALRIYVTSYETLASYSWLHESLAKIPSPSLKILVFRLSLNVKEEISNDIQVSNFLFYADSGVGEQVAKWQGLDELLTSSYFPDLEEVWLVFDDMLQEVECDFVRQTCLPQTYKRGILNISDWHHMDNPPRWDEIC